MNTDSKNLSYLLQYSTQVSNGLTETSADGACLAFDSRYGIMFCAYMPGPQGKYGESRGKIAMSCFPASQPTNIRFVTVSEDTDVYCNNVYGIGNGRVRVFYEKNSRAEGDHLYCYKDYDFITDTLSEEGTLTVKKEDGTGEPLTLSVQFKYLEARGLFAHRYMKTEQIGHCEMFDGDDGYSYGATTSYLSEVILFRSKDGFASVEFFAIFPRCAQYEFEYRIHNGVIYALYRTNEEVNAIYYTTSSDMGKSWSEPIALKDSIQCRPRLLIYHSHVLLAYNYYNTDTENRPEIQQGRTAIRLRLGENKDPNENELLADIHSKCGIVNICLCDIMGDLYIAYSTSELALEYQNGNSKVRGKDAIRYVKLGDITIGGGVS